MMLGTLLAVSVMTIALCLLIGFMMLNKEFPLAAFWTVFLLIVLNYCLVLSVMLGDPGAPKSLHYQYAQRMDDESLESSLSEVLGHYD